MMHSVQDRLEDLGYTLPSLAAPAGSYVLHVRSGNRLYLSGQIPISPDGVPIAGKVGVDFSVEEAKQIARRTALALLSAAQTALSSLDDIVRVIQLRGYVNAGPEFQDHPAVMNGCSELFVEIFGEQGRHVRATVGVASLPKNVPIEIEGVFEVR